MATPTQKKSALDQLMERFPTIDQQKIEDVLFNNGGHAGHAAACLREMVACGVKTQDPDDVEHVSTLLSCPTLFKQACQEHFVKFDKNHNGVLDIDEVITLTESLYTNFGLQPPSQGSVRASFAAMDENGDGVLSQREFRKFFEHFLRLAFFDVPKLQQLVEKGKVKLGGS